MIQNFKGAPKIQGSIPANIPPETFDSEFVKQARIPTFNPEKVPFLKKHASYNEDLFLSSFTKSNLIWSGVQKKGTSPSFEANSPLEHISLALKQEFPLSAPIPLPTEVVTSLDWLSTTPPPRRC